MPAFIQTENVRLYLVAETVNERGRYDLELFENDDFDNEIDSEDVGYQLNDLLDYLFGGGLCVEADERFEYNFSVSFDDVGNVCIQHNDFTIEIPDIIGKINAKHDDSKFYIMIDGEFSEYRWVVVESQGVVYSGE